MEPSRYHLAQVNIAVARAPTDSPVLADFMAALDPVNAVADATPGFLWRLQTEDGDATAIRPFDDERIMVNLSVWDSVAALKGYVYQSSHLEVMRRRREWFQPMADAYLALWWLPAGQTPTVADAKQRVTYLQRHGPSQFAFDFRHLYPAPGDDHSDDAGDAAGADWTGCPAG